MTGAMLPTQGQKRAVSDEFLLDLREDPGDWDLAFVDERGGSARGIAHRVNNWGAYGGGYEARVDHVDGRWELWMRWTGAAQPAADPAPVAVPRPVPVTPEPLPPRGYGLPLKPAEALAQLAGRVRECAAKAERVILQRELQRIADELVAVRRAIIDIPGPQSETPLPDYDRNCRARAKNPQPGKRICSKCGQTKDVEDFAFSDRAKGKRRSDCSDCYNAGQRSRYVRAGDKIVTVEVLEGDFCVGHPCPECGQPFEVGQHIQGDNVRHENCPPAAAR